MAYDEIPRKSIEVRDGKKGSRAGHDELIDRAKASGSRGDRSDAASDGAGYLGVDDLDKIRRRKLR